MFSWPDSAMTPFHSEKDTNWERAFRVPALIRLPGRISPGYPMNCSPDSTGFRQRWRRPAIPSQGCGISSDTHCKIADVDGCGDKLVCGWEGLPTELI
jgi:hypothetical protein